MIIFEFLQYLLHLEDILIRVHKAFYQLYDQMNAAGAGTAAETSTGVAAEAAPAVAVEAAPAVVVPAAIGRTNSGSKAVKKLPEIPDMKRTVPYVKSKVLRGVNIVFSGIIPTNEDPTQAWIYKTAKSFGAEIHDHIRKSTSHLVAGRWGTTKVHAAIQMESLKVVVPQWIYSCFERWEHVDERLFVLTKENSLSLLAPTSEKIAHQSGGKSPAYSGGDEKEKNSEGEKISICNF